MNDRIPEWRGLSPAKLNLFLHITGRRSDGYHLLETLFQLLDWGDELHLVRRDDGRIVLHDALPGVSDDQHLAVRAARLLQQHCKVGYGVGIGIVKRIPMGGGLGGGSSNAATVLRVLNRLWDCRLDTDALAALGLQLGADVPVFVRGATAYAEGIGEQLQACPQPERWYVVVTPDVSVPTAKIFADPALTRDTPPVRIRALAASDWWQATRNDCEPVVRNQYPAVDRALTRLANFAAARMTGTGSSVFAQVSDEAQARQVLASYLDLSRDETCSSFIARGINVWPV